jgi:excisionase family DNA binding protein
MPSNDARRPPRTFTIRQAAELLDRSPKATLRAAKAGEIPAIRWGRSYLIPARALERILNGVLPPSEEER